LAAVYVVHHGGPGESGEMLVVGPDAGFADRRAADARRAELDRAARRHLNPFRGRYSVDLGDLCSAGRPAFEAAAAAVGLTLPTPRLRPVDWSPEPLDETDWASWWAEQVAPLPPDRQDGLWAALDRLAFYTVTAVPLED
jgi:hypothetical protein